MSACLETVAWLVNAHAAQKDLPEYQFRRHGYVYAISQGCAGPIKLGWAYDPWQRRDTLQPASGTTLYVVARMPGTTLLERAIHRKLSAHRLRNEWFLPAEPVVRVVSAMNAAARRIARAEAA